MVRRWAMGKKLKDILPVALPGLGEQPTQRRAELGAKSAWEKTTAITIPVPHATAIHIGLGPNAIHEGWWDTTLTLGNFKAHKEAGDAGHWLAEILRLATDADLRRVKEGKP
jgi:hypothetical protein